MAFFRMPARSLARATVLAAAFTLPLRCAAAFMEQHTAKGVVARHDDTRSSSAGPAQVRVQAKSDRPALCDLDLYYGQGFLDICHYGRSAEDRPVVILVHGAKSSKAQFYSDWGSSLYSSGYVVASVQYRVARCPEDVAAATEWVRTNAHNFGADPERIAYFGASWGGTCASIVGLTMHMPGLRAMALASASVAVSPNSIVEANPVSVLLMQSKYDRLVNLNRSQEMYRALRNMGFDTHKIRYNANTNRLLNIGDDPLIKLREYFNRVFVFKG